MRISKVAAGAVVGVIAAGAWALPAAAASPYAMNRHFSSRQQCLKTSRTVVHHGAVVTKRCTTSPTVRNNYTLVYYYPA